VDVIVKGCSIDMQKIFYPPDIASGVICGGGQKSVVRSAHLSSKIMDGFQKNQLVALIIGWWGYECRRFIKISAFWATIRHFVIFDGENFPLFLWEEL